MELACEAKCAVPNRTEAPSGKCVHAGNDPVDPEMVVAGSLEAASAVRLSNQSRPVTCGLPSKNALKCSFS